MEGFVSFDCIIKNLDMETILAAIRKDLISAEPMVAEMLVVRWCLTIAQELKLERVIIRSDALIAVDNINSILKNVVP